VSIGIDVFPCPPCCSCAYLYLASIRSFHDLANTRIYRHWFYEDFIRTDRPNLPSFNLKSFSSLFFLSCPLLSHWLNPGSSDDGDNGYNYERLWERFMKYKNRVPVCGGILLDSACEHCVLVKGWKSGASWGFPKGKINDEEERWGCAVREVSRG
jgi:mRNA-decapping enzyme subunit 2